MQISRHWRLNAQRYRLEGVRYNNGTVSLEKREMPAEDVTLNEITRSHNTVETKPNANNAPQRMAS